MANFAYLPTSDSDLLVWFNNFQSKFTTVGPTLGFTAADLTKVTNDYQMLAFVVEAAEAVRNQSQAHTSYKNTLRDGPIGTVMPVMPTAPSLSPPELVTPGIVPRLRAVVQRIKAQPQYNETIGNNLGIIAAAAPPSATPSKPTATATAEPGSAVRIDWVKAGFDGVLVEGQRAAEILWTALGTDLQSPYNDTRAPLQPGVPEVRRYRLRYVKGDVPTGEYTDTMTVTTTL